MITLCNLSELNHSELNRHWWAIFLDLLIVIINIYEYEDGILLLFTNKKLFYLTCAVNACDKIIIATCDMFESIIFYSMNKKEQIAIIYLLHLSQQINKLGEQLWKKTLFEQFLAMQSKHKIVINAEENILNLLQEILNLPNQ